MFHQVTRNVTLSAAMSKSTTGFIEISCLGKACAHAIRHRWQLTVDAVSSLDEEYDTSLAPTLNGPLER